MYLYGEIGRLLACCSAAATQYCTHRTRMIKPYILTNTVARAVQRAIQATTRFSATDSSQHPMPKKSSLFMHSTVIARPKRAFLNLSSTEHKNRRHLLMLYIHRHATIHGPQHVSISVQSFPHFPQIISIGHLFSVSHTV